MQTDFILITEIKRFKIHSSQVKVATILDQKSPTVSACERLRREIIYLFYQLRFPFENHASVPQILTALTQQNKKIWSYAGELHYQLD